MSKRKKKKFIAIFFSFALLSAAKGTAKCKQPESSVPGLLDKYDYFGA